MLPCPASRHIASKVSGLTRQERTTRLCSGGSGLRPPPGRLPPLVDFFSIVIFCLYLWKGKEGGAHPPGICLQPLRIPLYVPPLAVSALLHRHLVLSFK